VLEADDGGALWWDADGSAWRVAPYLAGTGACWPAAELGRGLAEFHQAVAGIDPGRLRVTLPGFHDPPGRLRALDEVAARDPAGRAGAAAPELATVAALRTDARLLGLPERPVRVAHFDAKADNFLGDAVSGRFRALIDLDTLMPGSWLWDVGDMLRSAAATAPEDEPVNAVDTGAAAAIVAAWTDGVGARLTDVEQAALPLAAPVVTFEQAVRFLADHLGGDAYYRTSRPGQNLDRARSQLALLRSMLDRPSAMIGA
jgi:N-acetylhexosamine 1-kinase